MRFDAQKIGLDRGGWATEGDPSAFTMKHPPEQVPDQEAKRLLESFTERIQRE